VGKPEGNKSLRRVKLRWVNNIRMGLREIGWGGVDRIDLVQDKKQWRPLVNTMIKFWVL
jgi:hypothetical protein